MNKRAERLSKKLAKIAGLRVSRSPSLAGVLTDDRGEVFHWFKCPRHGTWLQPAHDPFEHWKCSSPGCIFKRAAKMRTRIERTLFRIHRRIEELGE